MLLGSTVETWASLSYPAHWYLLTVDVHKSRLTSPRRQVSFMIPGLAFLYAGLARRKSTLSLIWAVCASNAIVIFQWFICGYSLAFSPSATNGFIGNLAHFGLKGVLGDPSPGSPLVPDLLFAFFQMEFAAVTVGILMGGIAERGRVLPAMIFSFFWVTFVYCPLACWAWNTNGWALQWVCILTHHNDRHLIHHSTRA